MSLITDVVKHIEYLIDSSPLVPQELDQYWNSLRSFWPSNMDDTARTERMEIKATIIRDLSALPNLTLSPRDIRNYLIKSGLAIDGIAPIDPGQIQRTPDEDDLETALITKASLRVYHALLDMLVDDYRTISADMAYWNDTSGLASHYQVYAIQTLPWRFKEWIKDVFAATWDRDSPSFSRRFHATRRHVFANIRRKCFDLPRVCRAEALHKVLDNRLLLHHCMTSIGFLREDCFPTFYHRNDWATTRPGSVAFTIALMEEILDKVYQIQFGGIDFTKLVTNNVRCHVMVRGAADLGDSAKMSASLACRLMFILDVALPRARKRLVGTRRTLGKPSRTTRYWLPFTIGLFSSAMVYKVMATRQDAIARCIREVGGTVRDFWRNWVFEPGLQLLRTIRHDEASEIAIMSRDSLKADRESLERMVVDFASDNSTFISDLAAESSDIKACISELVARGDMTPVLRSYERDLRRPFLGVVQGNLVRSLLIQCQKTKVDLEVAMAGINALLKSQELVFGLVGLTPGMLMTFAAGQYFYGLMSGRAWLRRGKKTQRAMTLLHQADYILTVASDAGYQALSKRELGRMFCVLNELRVLAVHIIPPDFMHMFRFDVGELSAGGSIRKKKEILNRIRWTYGLR